jgi:uncharacterized protein YecE (DUF72 family)
MPRTQEKNKKANLTREERRARRELRREKQRKDNIDRAAKMHAARLQMEAGNTQPSKLGSKTCVFVGCSGWFYWKWRGLFYPADLPTGEWFKHYAKRLDTVEINASFYSWPTVANVKAWKRQPGKRDFVYTVKVCELITHIRKFNGTKTLIKDFGLVADILGERMGCFLFQLPPSYSYSKARLTSIIGQLDPARRNVFEFRHKSWWNDTVYAAFRETGTIFCSCSGPRLPDELVRTADDIYLRLHGPERWYRHNYSNAELEKWVERIKASGAKRAWIYFNNDYEAHAPRNAAAMRRLLASCFPKERPKAARILGAKTRPVPSRSCKRGDRAVEKSPFLRAPLNLRPIIPAGDQAEQELRNEDNRRLCARR